MQAARPVLLLPLLLTFPFTAYAVPILGTAILVEYEGAISEVSEAPPEYAVGDRIAGRLFIDRRFGHFGQIGPVEASYGSASPAFVSGFWPSAGDGFDILYLANEKSVEGGNGPIDMFTIQDWLVGTDAPTNSGKTFDLSAVVRGFLPSTKLDQMSFELTSADVDDPDEHMTGGIRWNNLGLFAFVQFTIDRLSVKPNYCVAP